MGLLDLLGGSSSAPKPPDPVKLDSGAQKVLDNSLSRASESSDAFANRTSGESTARGLLQNDDQAGQEQARSGGSNPFGQAIRQSYQQQSDYGMGRIRQVNELSAKMAKSQELQQYAKAALGQQNAMTQQMQFLTDAYNKQESARAGFINSLFQTVNTGVGIAAGNGAFHSKKSVIDNSGGSGGGSVGGYDGGRTTVSDYVGFANE